MYDSVGVRRVYHEPEVDQGVRLGLEADYPEVLLLDVLGVAKTFFHRCEGLFINPGLNVVRVMVIGPIVSVIFEIEHINRPNIVVP